MSVYSSGILKFYRWFSPSWYQFGWTPYSCDIPLRAYHWFSHYNYKPLYSPISWCFLLCLQISFMNPTRLKSPLTYLEVSCLTFIKYGYTRAYICNRQAVPRNWKRREYYFFVCLYCNAEATILGPILEAFVFSEHKMGQEKRHFLRNILHRFMCYKRRSKWIRMNHVIDEFA